MSIQPGRSEAIRHGQILGGTITTPDLDAALYDYRDVLGMELIEHEPLSGELAASWGCPASGGARSAILRPRSGAVCALRLVEQPLPADFRPSRTFGWAAFEHTVENVFDWPERLAASGFTVVGPPREIPGMPYFVAMQVTGRGQELLYLNEVRRDTPTADLPRAAAAFDRLFIAVLAAPDLLTSATWYRERLGLDDGGSFRIPYTMISKAFDLPPGSLHELSMVQSGRRPVAEIDAYPSAATTRAGLPGWLPPGNAILTLAVDQLDALEIALIAQPVIRASFPYEGRRSATTIGPAGELLEVVEVGSGDAFNRL